MRNALAYVPKTQETVVAAAIRQAFIQPDRETGQVWRHVADQLRPRFEKLGRLMDEAEHDVQTQNRYMQIEGFAEPADKTADLKPLQITPKAA
jgi:transposase-like protein